MAGSAYIVRRTWRRETDTRRVTRYRVMFRLGGRGTRPIYFGSFDTMRDAQIRRGVVAGMLARGETPPPLPEFLAATDDRPKVRTLRAVAEEWRRSRIDVSDSTATTHTVNLSRILPVLGDRDFEVLTPADVSAWLVGLHDEGRGLKRETLRKTRSTLAMVLDFGGRKGERNPARDSSVKLPDEIQEEVNPPTAPHVLAVLRLLPSAYRLPLLVYDGTGMRAEELERLTWGDVDEHDTMLCRWGTPDYVSAGRWRVSKATAKTRRSRWVPVPDSLFRAVVDLVPREDRDLGAPVLNGFDADAFRTALTRACKAAGVPHFSPHDLRHRRATLWHLSGVPAAEASGWLGHSAQEHHRRYVHAHLVDRTEIDYADVLVRARTVLAPVIPERSEIAH